MGHVKQSAIVGVCTGTAFSRVITPVVFVHAQQISCHILQVLLLIAGLCCRSFLPPQHVLHKDAVHLFGAVPVPARNRLQIEVNLDLATPAAALPSELKAATSPTVLVDSMPIIQGPWNYLQHGNQVHSHQLMARERKAWRDKYVRSAPPASRQQKALLQGVAQPARHQRTGRQQVSTSTAPAALPPRARPGRRAQIVPTFSISMPQTLKTGEEVEADFLQHVEAHKQHTEVQEAAGDAEEHAHLQIEEHDEQDVDFEEEQEEVQQGPTYTSLTEQVRLNAVSTV